MIEQCVEDLVELGFTRLESEVYVHLLQHSPATGYKIAKAIGRPNSNTYRAIATLETKGAILVDDADKKQFHAVPFAELLEQIERRFGARQQAAAEHLSQLSSVETDDRIYQIGSVDQLYTRCRRMLAECREMVVVDIFPKPLDILQPDIEAAAARGVNVILQVYQPATVAGVRAIVHPMGADLMESWPLQAVLVMADGQESLLAAVDRHDENTLHKCCWTASPFLAYVLLSYSHAEVLLSLVRNEITENTDMKPLDDMIVNWLSANSLSRSPGKMALQERFRQSKGES